MKKIIVDVGATGFPAAMEYPDGFRLRDLSVKEIKLKNQAAFGCLDFNKVQL